MTDRGYLNLLGHLNRPDTTLPLTTIQASIAHYLAHLNPSPTPLAASVITSPYFRNSRVSHAHLSALSTAFRHAVHIRIKLLKDEKSSVFTRGVAPRTGEWAGAALKGLQGGDALLRLSCTTGLLIGLEDWDKELGMKEGRVRRRVEEELVIALAEVMDLYPPVVSGWEKEFKSTDSSAEDALSVAFLVVAPSLPLVASYRLKALPLATLIRLLLKTADSAFQSGTYLSSLPSSVSKAENDGGKLRVEPSSQFARNLHKITSNPALVAMASLSAMCAQALQALADSRPTEAWIVMCEAMQTLDTLTRNLERDWLRSSLAAIADEGLIVEDTKEILTTMWTTLKTLLFTTIRLTQSILSIVVFVPEPSSTSLTTSISSLSSESTLLLSSDPLPFVISLTVLRVLSQLSFVLPQFGGVASTGEGGFVELKKAFYTALDVLSADTVASASFVRELHESLNPGASTWPTHFLQAKKAYILAVVEQLVSVLSNASIENDVFPLCEPHLDDPSYRETYESAHSVMLSVFASHAQKSSEELDAKDNLPTEQLAFAERYVPTYVQCLIRNSCDGKLNSAQLSLAYAALVRSASYFRPSASTVPTSGEPSMLLGEIKPHTTTSGDAYSWFCIDTLLSAIHTDAKGDHLHRLHLALIACVPSVSFTLLPKLLEALRGVIQREKSEERRQELVRALFKEISESVGDEEKELAVAWWYDNVEKLGGERLEEVNGLSNDGKEKGKELVAKL